MVRPVRWPTAPSKRINAILLGAFIVTVLVCPIAIRSATSTSPAVNGEGGTKKSPLLIAVPPGVVTDIRPDVALVGTLVLRVLAVDAITAAVVPLNETWLFVAVVSKLLPFTMTLAPGAPIQG